MSSRVTMLRSCGLAPKALEGDAEWGDKVMELMAAVDESIPQPERETDKPFLMPVEDVFTIYRSRDGRHRPHRARHPEGERGRSTSWGIHPEKQTTTVTGIEMFRKLLDEGRAGENVAPAASWHQARGRRARPGRRASRVRSRRTPTSRRRSTSCRRTRAAGTRRSSTTTSPQFYFRTTDVTGVVDPRRRAPRWSCRATPPR